MKIPTVNSFLGCFDLFKGASFLGYLSAISYGLVAALLLIDIVFDAEATKYELLSDQGQETTHFVLPDHSRQKRADDENLEILEKLPEILIDAVNAPKETIKTAAKGAKKIKNMIPIPTVVAKLGDKS